MCEMIWSKLDTKVLKITFNWLERANFTIYILREIRFERDLLPDPARLSRIHLLLKNVCSVRNMNKKIACEISLASIGMRNIR